MANWGLTQWPSQPCYSAVTAEDCSYSDCSMETDRDRGLFKKGEPQGYHGFIQALTALQKASIPYVDSGASQKCTQF